MAALTAHRKYTMQEYLELQPSPTFKFEFAAGQIFLMAGGTPEHGVCCANLIALLVNQLKGRPCRVQTSDVRIRVDARDLNTYPDVSVVCGTPVVDRRDINAVTNPCLLVEVLSPGTEEYDRGDKLAAYKQIPALNEVVLVAHDAKRIEVVRREADGTWSTHSASAGETLILALGCEVAVDDVYFDATE